MNIPIKAWEQVAQNMQKSLVKKPPSTGTVHNIEPATKTSKTSNLATTITNELTPQLNENGLISDLLPDDPIDLKAGERLEAIISNVMAKELISTPSTREEQILRKQQILEELQKVERELQEKAQQQLLISAQHQQHQQKHSPLQQALQNPRLSVHQIIMKQLEEQKRILSISSQSAPSITELPDVPLSNNLDKQVEKPLSGEIVVSRPSLKPNISESSVTVSNGGSHSSEQSHGNDTDKAKQKNNQEEKISNGNTSGTCVKANGGQQSLNGGSQSHGGGM